MTTECKFELSFVAVGPQRTGSTWLHEVLENHPSISLPIGIKETMFFDKFYRKGIDWLSSHYSISDGKVEYGEVAPTYFASDTVMNRIKSHYPDCKIFINVRNPVKHAYSMYLHESSKGRISGELNEIINSSPGKLRSGMYADWIPKWQKTFGTENVCLVWMDQIKSDPESVYKEVCNFLNVSADFYLQGVGARRVNSSKEARFPTLTRFGIAIYQIMREYRLHSLIRFCKRLKLDSVTFASGKSKSRSGPSHADFENLLKLYSADIDFLERTTGRDLSMWKYDENQESNTYEPLTSTE